MVRTHAQGEENKICQNQTQKTLRVTGQAFLANCTILFSAKSDFVFDQNCFFSAKLFTFRNQIFFRLKFVVFGENIFFCGVGAKKMFFVTVVLANVFFFI